ncbi:sugar ABC transporter permease [Rhodobacteraceae bacterium CCMM004]|nr:sugar ABC transporter permease [Rhodobacteraceae bacterium CCMM004]
MKPSESSARVASSEGTRTQAARARSRREFLTDLIYIAPQYVIYIGLQLLPFAIALPIIFTDQVDFLDQDVNWVGFDNIASLFQAPLDDRLYQALRRTVIFSVVNYLMVFLFGFLLALAMFELVSKLKGIFFTIIYMPWMLSGIGVGLIMVMLFSTDTGSFNLIVSELGADGNAFDAKSETTALFVLPFMYGWKAAGFNMALFLGGLLAIPTETIESARMDGAGYWKRVWYIYLPQIVPSIIIATIFSIINSFGIFDELVGLGALAGNQNAEFMSIFIYQLGFGSATMGGAKIGTLAQGITASLVIFLPLVFLAFWLNRLQKKMSYH